MFSQIQKPISITKIIRNARPSARPLKLVMGHCQMSVKKLPPSSTASGGEVHVLKVHDKIFIHRPYVLETLPSKQHGYPAQPFNFAYRVVLSAIFFIESYVCKVKIRQLSVADTIDPSIFQKNLPRCSSRAALLVEQLNETIQPLGLDGYIVVQEADVLTLSLRHTEVQRLGEVVFGIHKCSDRREGLPDKVDRAIPGTVIDHNEIKLTSRIR